MKAVIIVSYQINEGGLEIDEGREADEDPADWFDEAEVWWALPENGPGGLFERAHGSMYCSQPKRWRMKGVLGGATGRQIQFNPLVCQSLYMTSKGDALLQ